MTNTYEFPATITATDTVFDGTLRLTIPEMEYLLEALWDLADSGYAIEFRSFEPADPDAEYRDIRFRSLDPKHAVDVAAALTPVIARINDTDMNA